MITSDVPKFHDELIPAIAASMIITLRDFLLKCRSVSEMFCFNPREREI